MRNSTKPFNFKKYNTQREEREFLGEQIRRDIRDGLDPRWNILVLVLHDQPGTVAEALHEKFGIDIYHAGFREKNYPYSGCDWGDSTKFREDGAVTVTNLVKAKGNEADVVYIVGLDKIAREEGDIMARNKLFVALTRSRGWVRLSGVGNYPLYNEVEAVESALRKDPCRLNFQLRTPKFPLNATEDDPDGLTQSSLAQFG